MLTIHLKRFEFEMTTGNMIKVNDRFAFFRQIDLDQYLDEVRIGKIGNGGGRTISALRVLDVRPSSLKFQVRGELIQEHWHLTLLDIMT